MANFIPIEGLRCPVCGENYFHEDLAKQKLYYCGKPNSSFEFCGVTRYVRCAHMQAYCEQCEKILDQDDFGFRNGAYECKKCGKVNWPLTDYYKRNDEMRNMIRTLNQKGRL